MELMEGAVAIIGMAGRFPGSEDVDSLWRNLRQGVEGITFFTEEEMREAGTNPELLQDPHFVAAAGALKDVDLFDAGLFGFSPREAEITDPQLRLFLETCWQALEVAGCDPQRSPGPVGVFAGCGQSSYLLNIYSNPRILQAVGEFRVLQSNRQDFLATWASYKLNLQGPSLAVQTACSTSLVAVHLAVQSLLNGESDVALAGGVSVDPEQIVGYLHSPDHILSPDGHCRSFDAEAAGTVGGNGVAVVTLKRLEDALENGDNIRAVIRGSAINNDGSQKVGFTAPSVEGQARAIAEAWALAGVDLSTAGFIEAHGTATSLGDPIEVAALHQVFQGQSDRIALGSVKSNLGHLDSAAGITGLIKAVLALEHGEIPPTLHFQRPNPHLNLDQGPFFVNSELLPWPRGEEPRRAGVSSFGIGGTNAHVVLEEAPPQQDTSPSRSMQLLLLSARSTSALEQASRNLADFLDDCPSERWPDVAFTLQTGRQELEQRRVVVARSPAAAAAELRRSEPRQWLGGRGEGEHRAIVFLFPGQGSQYVGMAAGLYRHEAVFREHFNACAEQLRGPLEIDPRRFLQESSDDLEERLGSTATTQPLLFAVEYALAQLWRSWGIEPTVMIGHSIGEYVAACLAGVFTLEEGLRLVSARGRLMESLPTGGMLSVGLSEEELMPLLGQGVELAAVNGPRLCAVSGPTPQIEAFAQRLEREGHGVRELHTSHAFHSRMMDPILEPFREVVAGVALQPPQVPVISNHTGELGTAEEFTDPDYWVEHLRRPVRFSQGIEGLLRDDSLVFLEVGPGTTLSHLARQHDGAAGRGVIASLRHPREERHDLETVLEALGRLWLHGVRPDWAAFYQGEGRRRIPLPTYPFERRRYWLPQRPFGPLRAEDLATTAKRHEVERWLYLPSWQRSTPVLSAWQRPHPTPPEALPAPSESVAHWLVFADPQIGAALVERLEAWDQKVLRVDAGSAYKRSRPGRYTVDPRNAKDFQRLLQESLEEDDFGRAADLRVVFLWGLGSGTDDHSAEACLERGYFSLLHLVQALALSLEATGREARGDLRLVGRRLHRVLGDEPLCPACAAALGPLRVIPQEFPGLNCGVVELEPESAGEATETTVAALLGELQTPQQKTTVAHRGGYRWVSGVVPLPGADYPEGKVRNVRPEGIYLITGGLGGVGAAMAEVLARISQEANPASGLTLILTGRSELPPREQWTEWRETHGEGDFQSRRMGRIETLEALGATVRARSADVADEVAMERLLAEIEAEDGPLNGVIHAAGLIGPQILVPLSQIDRESSTVQFQAKMKGTAILDRLLRRRLAAQGNGRSLDFCLGVSSLASQLGGLGFAAYAAANLFLDSFAQAPPQSDDGTTLPWRLINWDGWSFDGADPQVMTVEEGKRAFRRILALDPVPQLLVSATDLEARLQRWIEAPQPRLKDHPEEEEPIQHPRPELESTYVAPRDAREMSLAALWGELLGVEQVGVFDNFFELGGHSLLATQLFARLRSKEGIHLPLRTIFDASTIAELAEIIEAGREGEGKHGEARSLQIPPTSREVILPLSFAQQRWWFLSELEPDSSAYNLFSAIEIRGSLVVSALRRALNRVVERHEVLRTTFPARDGEPHQAVAEAVNLALPLIDLEALGAVVEGSGDDSASGLEQLEWLEQLESRESRRPFELDRDVLLRGLLVRLAPKRHIFLLSIHHIVADAWSIGILVREVASLYREAAGEGEAVLPELPIQYADFAVWQRESLQGEALEEQIHFWRQALGENPPRLDLPADLRPHLGAAHPGGRETRRIGSATARALPGLAWGEGTTLFGTLLATTAVVLGRWSEKSEVVIGSPVSGRSHEEIQGLIGCFLNTLAFRIELPTDGTFRNLLRRTRDRVLDTFAHEALPFEKVVEEIQPQRDLTRHPVFEVMLNVLNTPKVEIRDVAGLTLSFYQQPEQEAKLPLTLYAIEGGEGELILEVAYQRDRFLPRRMEIFLAQLEGVLEQVVADPDRSLSSLSLLEEGSRKCLPDPSIQLEETLYPTLPELFLRAVKSFPDQLAVTAGEDEWSYRDLAAAVAVFQTTLEEAGMKAGEVVAVMGQRSPGLIAALLAVLAQGGVILPLDPALPPARRHQMLELAKVSRAVRVGAGENDIRDLPQLTMLALPESEGDGLGERLPTVRATDPDGVAYLFFTSGTTGVPKGVQGRHNSLSHFLLWQRETFGIGPEDGFAQLTGLSFDVVLRDLFTPLISGAAVHLPGDDDLAVDRMLPFLRRRRVTALHTVPSVARLWLGDGAGDGHGEDSGLGDAASRNHLDTLRLVFFAGEPLTDVLVRRWRRRFGDTSRIINLYGPTETTLAKCFFEVPEPPLPGVQPVGSPLPAAQALILVDNRLAGVGEIGEIILRTPYRSHGYLGEEAEATARFRPNPFREDPTDLLYHTGDRGRFRLDGSIAILGRIDDQVKIRGVRVELAEIRALLESHPEVLQGEVLAREGEDAEKALAGYILPRTPGLTAGELRRYLTARLPVSLVPSSFTFLEAFPLNANGKVDRSRLPAPSQAPSSSGSDTGLGGGSGEVGGSGPRNSLEEILAGIWARVLGRETVGVEDNFFDLGGHSLLATQVVSRIRGTLEVDLELAQLFQNPTVAQLARVVETGGQGRDGIPELRRVSRDGPLPLSYSQERMWVVHRLDPESSAYNLPNALELLGDLKVEVLEQALREILRRHEALRTVFPESQGEPRQEILPPEVVPLTVLDLSALDSEAAAQEVDRQVTRAATRPFPLERGPLLRTLLLRSDARRHTAIFVAHHIISDAWSMSILVREVSALYRAFAADQPSPLEPLPVQYADFAHWQRRWMGSPDHDRQLDYWRSKLSGASPLALPTDRPRSSPGGQGAEVHFQWPEELGRGLLDLSRRSGVSLSMTLLAGFLGLLHRLSGEVDLLIGTNVANRNRVETEGLIGFFVNDLALRTDVSDDPSFESLLPRVREVTLGAFAHQDLPFDEVVRALRLRRDAARGPLFDVVFNHHNIPRGALEIGELELAPREPEISTARFDLTLHVWDQGEVVGGRLNYRTALFDASTVENFAEQYRNLLASALEDPGRRLSALRLLSAEVREEAAQERRASRLSRLRELQRSGVE